MRKARNWAKLEHNLSLVQMVRSCNNLFCLLLLFVCFVFVHHREGYPCSVWREHEIWRSFFVCCRRRPEDRWPYMHVPCMWEVSGLMASFKETCQLQSEWHKSWLCLSCWNLVSNLKYLPWTCFKRCQHPFFRNCGCFILPWPRSWTDHEPQATSGLASVSPGRGTWGDMSIFHNSLDFNRIWFWPAEHPLQYACGSVSNLLPGVICRLALFPFQESSSSK